MTDLARCPKCRSVNLSVTEVHEEYGTTDPGPVVVREGLLYPVGPFIFEAGNPTHVLLRCADCGHKWRSRRWVGGTSNGPR